MSLRIVQVCEDHASVAGSTQVEGGCGAEKDAAVRLMKSAIAGGVTWRE
jgi:hypothetical protein